MAKVKFVQVALSHQDNLVVERYLDDRGRVWSYEWGQHGRFWKQIKLPDEPKEQADERTN